MPPLVVESSDLVARRQEPVSCGVPWPRGVLHDPAGLALYDTQDRPVPLQTRALDRWPDGSVRWALLDWQADIEAGAEAASYRVEVAGAAVPAPGPEVRVANEGDLLLIDTGGARFRLGAGARFPFDMALATDGPAIDPVRTRFVVEDGHGRQYEPAIGRAMIVEAGPLRVAVRLEGDLAGSGAAPLGQFLAHLHFFAGSAAVRFDLTIHNPRPSIHPGNHWDLGAGGSVDIRDASLTIALPTGDGPATIRGSAEPGLPWRPLGGPIEVYQDSSGGEHWQSPVHLNRRRVVPNSFRGYRLWADGAEEVGLRATPILAIERDGHALAVAMEYFWQDFPKAMEADGDALVLRLFPRQYADVHELQGGERKTHTFFAAFGPDAVAGEPLAWCRAPLRPRAEPTWYAEAAAAPHLTPRDSGPEATYLGLVDAAIEGPDTFAHKREAIDEYGWRHFGELWADHEAVFHRGAGPRVSHYNNQYDVVGGCALQFLRSGDWRWWMLMHEMARHVADVDIYHTDGDKAAYNRGLFWHTYHYVDADTSTHRAYPRPAGIPGGGPSGGHNYSTGLMLHHLLTGDPLSREAALELARWTVDMDDGRKTVFRWLSKAPTGHATASGTLDYHGPGRAPANCITTLVNAHRLAGDETYLAKADEIIRRCIHPSDDIVARDLLDAENKWFYTMFLQALGYYLDHKAGLDRLDQMYAYARESLLRYARWMTEHEYPYLERPEQLEYPTETWAAQDMRKCEVFQHAAKHASGMERGRFLERAEFFFRSSTDTLAGMETRTLARPVALLLGNGSSRAYFLKHPRASAPPPDDPPTDFGQPSPFVPQKTRALRRFRALAAAGVLGIAALIAGAVALLAS